MPDTSHIIMMIHMGFALTYLLTLEWFLIIFTFLTFLVAVEK